MSNDHLDIDEGEFLAPLPKGVPADFRERLVLALKTTDMDTLAAAEQDFQGCFTCVEEYFRAMLARHVAEWLAWVLDYAPVERLRAAHEADTGRVVWTIQLENGVLVFESSRHGSARGRR